MLAYMSAIFNLYVFHGGTPSNINYHVLRKLCAKCGAFVRPVTITFEAKPPDYKGMVVIMSCDRRRHRLSV